MSKPIIKIALVTWRDGRPRYFASKKQRAMGFKGEDLRHSDGRWFSVNEAMVWSQTRQAEINGTAAKLPPKKKLRDLGTIGHMFAEWLKIPKLNGINIVEGRLERPALAHNTVMSYRGSVKLIERFDNGQVWATPTILLTPKIIDGILRKIEIEHGLVLARGARTVMSIAFKWARNKGMVESNPMLETSAMPVPAPRVRFGSPQEMKHFVATADAMGFFEIGDAIMLGLWTGQRRSDRLALKFDDISNANEITFRQQKKGGAPLLIPATGVLQDRLKQTLIRRQKLKIDLPNVIVNERSGEKMHVSSYGYKFRLVRTEAVIGMPEHKLKPCPSIADFRDQDLRDTAVTWLALSGATKYHIASITGHSLETIDSIIKHYLGNPPELARDAIAKLAKWYEGAIRHE